MPCVLSESQFNRLAAARATLRLLEGGCASLYSRFSPVPEGGGIRFARVEVPGQYRALRAEFDLCEDLEVGLEDEREVLLTFFTDGRIRGSVAGERPRPLDFRVGHAMLRTSNRAGFKVVLHCSSFVQLRLQREFLRSWITQLGLALPQGFADELASVDGRVLDNEAWTLDTQMVLDQIADFRYGPAAFLPFLQAKSLELLTLFTCEFAARRSAGTALCGAERAVQIAHELLLSDIVSPLTVLHLARKVGLRVQPLQAAFRARYGATPYAYLRNARLERARTLLAGSERAILDIVQEVGWSCPSRFSAAFRAKYGTTPGAYRRRSAR
ncbi:MAG: helix-turn-helix transcriptional regulator [Burkholderiales bacterium]